MTAGLDKGTPLPGPGDTHAEEIVALIRERSSIDPVVGVVLGSGLGDAVAGDVQTDHELSFEALPGFPPPTVPGHAGRLLLGSLYEAPAAVFLGRVHLYEGHGIASTTLIPQVCAALGARMLILTNAAGGLDEGMAVGQLMLIRDHINLLGVNPLSGWRFPDGTPAFVDLADVYDPGLLGIAEEVAAAEGLGVASGVYAAVPGPSYETPAEIEMLSRLGAQAVGMSTIPEAVAAAALGLSVLGISCITDVAGTELSHEEVLAAASKAAPDLRTILAGVIPRLGQSQ